MNIRALMQIAQAKFEFRDDLVLSWFSQSDTHADAYVRDVVARHVRTS